MTSTTVQHFIARWQDSGAAERANYQLFLTELCDILDVPRPEPTKPDDRDNAYVFERAVTILHGDGITRKGFIDLYKRGCFVLEAKQGAGKQTQTALLADAARSQRTHRKRGTARRHTAGMHEALQRARNQAEAYTRALPAAEGRPPFLMVVDVGDTIELYAEFTRTGGTYVPFPDPRSHRLSLHDLLEGHAAVAG